MTPAGVGRAAGPLSRGNTRRSPRIPVVREENDERVFVQSQADNGIANLSDAFVHFQNHLLHRFGMRCLALLGTRAALDRIAGTLDRRMR